VPENPTSINMTKGHGDKKKIKFWDEGFFMVVG
jgi:hypothetical protein